MVRGWKVAVVVLLCTHAASAQTFDAHVTICRGKFVDRLNECLVDAISKLLPSLATGIPEMNLPSLEPLELGVIDFSQQEGPVTVNAYYSPVKVYGASKIDLKYFDLNLKNRTLHVGMTIPALHIRGKYKIEGKIFDLPVVGDGDFQTLFLGAAMEGIAYITPVRSGAMKTHRMNLHFTLSSLKTKMDNLLPDNKVLSDTVHHFINNNYDLLVEAIRPEVTRHLESLFTKIVDYILVNLPTEQLSRIENANTNDRHRKRTLQKLTGVSSS